MWADSKKVWFLKFCSTVQMLFNVENFLFSCGVMASVVLFHQHRINFETLNQNLKKTISCFGISPHAAGNL